MGPSECAAGFDVGIRYPFGYRSFWELRFRNGIRHNDLHESIIDRNNVYLAGIFELVGSSVAWNVRSRARGTHEPGQPDVAGW